MPPQPSIHVLLFICSGLGEHNDAELQQALALSLLECQPGQQHAEQQGAVPPPAGRQQEQEQQLEQGPQVMLVRARSPHSSAAAEVYLPADVEAAAQLPGCCSGDSCAAGGGLGEQWFMGLGRPTGDRRSSGGAGGGGMGSGGKSAAQREADELAKAIEASKREYEQQQQQQQQQQLARQQAQQEQAALCSSPPAGCGLAALGSAAAAEAAAVEDADLQRALELSRLEAGLHAGVFPVLASSAAAAGSPAGAGSGQPLASGEQDAFDLVLQDSPCAAAAPGPEQAAAEQGTAHGAAGSGSLAAAWNAGSSPEAAAAPAAAPTYVHAEIVEDDAPLAGSTAGTAGSEEGGTQPGSPGVAGSADADAAAAAAATDPADAAVAAAAAKQVQYRLHASVAHQGPAASCGHFTADVCDPATRVWHRLDDSVASRISATEARSAARQRECYLLFYVAG